MLKNDGCGVLVAGLAICVALLVIGFLLVTPLLENLNDAEAQRLQAEASLERTRGETEVNEIQARMDQDAQEQENWERRFYAWTVALTAFSQNQPQPQPVSQAQPSPIGLILLGAVTGAVTGLAALIAGIVVATWYDRKGG